MAIGLGDLPPSDASAASSAPAGAVVETEKKKKRKKKKKKAQTSQTPSINQLGEVHIYADIKDLHTFQVTQDALSGRCVVASRDLDAGELVLHESPFAKVVRRDCSTRHCANCCREVAPRGRVEADAPFAVYCSRTCKEHEAILRSAEAGALGKLAGISAVRDVDLDLLRMMLRLLIMRAKALGLCPLVKSSSDGSSSQTETEEAGVGTTEEPFLVEQWNNLYALMHHREDMAPEWISVVRAAAEDLLDAVPEWARFDVEEVVQLACRVNVNAHGLRDDSGSNLVIGVGLFPLTAMINHSCRPNCTFVYFEGKLEVRALEAISAGSELSVYYIDLLQNTSARRKELLLSKHFLCKCSRCDNPGAIDGYLDGVCCVDCGESGLLTSSHPPNPEDVLAAQLAKLDEGLSNMPTAGRGSGKGNGGKASGGSGGSTVARAISGSIAGSTMETSAAPSKSNSNGRGNATSLLTKESGGVSNTHMYCSACGRQYPASAVEESVARAKASWDAAMAVVGTKNFPSARRALEQWLQDFDAGSSGLPPTGTKNKMLKKRGKAKLHPANALVVQTLVPLSNCCNFEEDHSASARYLRRAVCAMEAVYPPNYPELGDFHAALADAQSALLDKSGQALPKKTKSKTVSERKQALERAAAIRTVCLGKEHPTTKKAMRALERA
ncbi:unnamed protein product [Scytosiphon promiscuus]